MSCSAPRLLLHLRGETIEVHGGWLSFLAVGEQTGGAYALIEETMYLDYEACLIVMRTGPPRWLEHLSW